MTVLPTVGSYVRIHYTYEWRCWHCEAIHQQSHNGWPGESLLVPTLPEGWRVMNERLYCPKHKLVQTVDGEPVGEL